MVSSGSGDVEYLAFTRVKLHVPGSFPTLQTVYVGLEYATVICTGHSQVNSSIIGE